MKRSKSNKKCKKLFKNEKTRITEKTIITEKLWKPPLYKRFKIKKPILKRKVIVEIKEIPKLNRH